MKTLENTQKQVTNKVSKVNADEETRLLNAKAKAAAAADIADEAAPEETKTKVKKVVKAAVRAESNEALGERLLKDKANEATILATFTAVYKSKQNITDKKFIAARAAIYMKIAKKRADARKAS